MSVTELNKTIPMITPKGPGRAFAMIDYSEEHNLIWVVAHDNGEIWSFQNHLVRLQSNITMGRDMKKKVDLHPSLTEQQERSRTWYRGTLDVKEALVQAANDAHLFGVGYIQFSQGEDGKVTAHRVQPADISIHREPIKED